MLPFHVISFDWKAAVLYLFLQRSFKQALQSPLIEVVVEVIKDIAHEQCHPNKRQGNRHHCFFQRNRFTIHNHQKILKI
jgi:hypothetical protein